MRVCAEPGCPTLIPKGARGGRCGPCERRRDRARGTRQDRGYDAAHDRLRADYQRRMDQGEAFDCWRCGTGINPTAWHLGHDDHNRSLYRGPECPPCNLATARRISPRA